MLAIFDNSSNEGLTPWVIEELVIDPVVAEDEDDEEFVEDAIIGSDTMKEFWDSLERNSRRRRKNRKTEFHYMYRSHQIPNYIGPLTLTDLELLL